MIQVEIQGLKKYLQVLQRTQKSVRSQVPLKRIGILIQNKINSYFNSQGQEGAPWEPLKSNPENKNILITTGALRSSFEFTLKKNEVVVGCRVEYSKYHQQNYEGKRFSSSNTIPRRPMLPPASVVAQIAEKQFIKYFQQVINKG